MSKPYNIGVAFGSGAARGIAHFGAIKAFEEVGLKIDIVSGTSAGSIAGLLYAAGFTADEMMEKVKSISVVKAYSFRLPTGGGLTDMSYLKGKLSEWIPKPNFEDLNTKLKVVVTNMNTGAAEVLEKGPWLDPVAASCSIPFAFKPIIINNQTYVDGGVMMNLPTQPLREVCNTVIGINVLPNSNFSNEKLKGWKNVGMRFGALVVLSNTIESIKHCDIFIEPHRLIHYPLFSVKKADDMFKLGYEETMKMMPKIMAQVGKTSTV